MVPTKDSLRLIRLWRNRRLARNDTYFFLRSSLVSRYRQLRDEPWKARAPESEERVQALAVGITTPWSGSGGAYKSQTYCPRLEGLVPWFWKPKLSTYL